LSIKVQKGLVLNFTACHLSFTTL